MRKMIAALLAAATIATPVFAQGREPRNRGFQPRGEVSQPVVREGIRQAFGGQREQRQEQRQERREARSQETAQVQRPARPDRQEFRQERRDDRQGFRQERREDRQGFRQERREDRQDLQQGDVSRREFRRDRVQDTREFRRDRAQDTREFRRDRFEDRRDFQRDRNWSGNNRGYNWNRDWRRDPRYNWQDWRRNNRGYNFGRYYAPRGWNYGYRRFSLGVILSAPLFAQNYWINDPYDYRLPPADGPYRWVRYYDDVLLVDVRDGRVVDVIHDFFW